MLKSPDWHLLIVWYFFLGGIAGGAYSGRVSFGTGAPPLGDIEVELEDERPDAVIDFLAESTVERRPVDPLR